jgi:acyl-CoA reductase-like NAD-dependent aldehyde dehydrogenase
MTEPVRIAIAHPDKLWIGGAWVSPASSAPIVVVSPDTERPVAEVAHAQPVDMDKAVAAARKAFDEGPWPRTSPKERARKVAEIGERLAARKDELAAAWTLQVGGLPRIAPFIVGDGVAHFTRAAALGETFDFERRMDSPRAPCALVIREPVGVVAAIAPWNAPFAIMAGKVANALIAGCTVVMKPSPETPLEAYIIAEACEAAGLPPGVVNLVPSDRESADHLVKNPGVDKVAFTGSTAVGKRIAGICAERMARYTLELGGKSAAIVLDDMPTAEAAKILGQTITVLSGQVCAMLSRAIVPAKRHDELAEAIAAEMQAVKVGYSSDPTTMMGPLAMKRQLERVESYVEKGKAEGAELVTGGHRPAHLNHGFFLEPTLFANVDNKSTIAQEEIFGPVLSLIPADDVDDAIRIANDSHYGLNGAVLTKDYEAAYKVARRVRSGTFGQNGMRADFALPFGGFKQSGVGREGGPEGLMAYLETKTVMLDGVPQQLA